MVKDELKKYLAYVWDKEAENSPDKGSQDPPKESDPEPAAES